MTTFLTWLGCWAALVVACYETGRIAEAASTAQAKRDLARRLVGARPEMVVYGWASVLARIVDRVFGRHPLSIRCFSVSLFVSVASLLFWDLLLYRELVGFVGRVSTAVWARETLSDARWTFAAASLLVSSIVVDYASVLETRFVIRIVSRRLRRWSAIWTVVTADLLCTIAAAFFIPWTLLTLADLSAEYLDDGPEGGAAYGLIMEQTAQLALPVFLSTCTTSLWLLLFVLGGLLNIAASRLPPWQRWVVRGLNLQGAPFLATAIICAVLVTTLMASAGAIVTLYSW